MTIPVTPAAPPSGSFAGRDLDLDLDLALVLDLVRAISHAADIGALSRVCVEHLRPLMPCDRLLVLQRRRHTSARVLLACGADCRTSVSEGGWLGGLLGRAEPVVVEELTVADEDPSASWLRGMRSLVAVPSGDDGAAPTLTVALSAAPAAFDSSALGGYVVLSNLIAQAACKLDVVEELRQAYDLVERELRVVAAIQRSLLPETPPVIPTLDLAVRYQTAQWAGGDFYDFFPLTEGRWGLLIADASGHGTPAAVMMAIAHSIAHGHPEYPETPSGMLRNLNERLAVHYTAESATFVTAFYGVYDPARRELTYGSAGHIAPRLRRGDTGAIRALEGPRHYPLGLFTGQDYRTATHALRPGDLLILYTDGIIEALDPEGQPFGPERFDAALAHCPPGAEETARRLSDALDQFTLGRHPTDDQTLLVVRVS